MEIKTQKKLDYLADTKAAIKAALIEQGQEVSDADTFRSYADKVLAISGVPADVHYVTFMSEYGLTELYERPVADGDNCADPVDRGYIDAPTKDSTPQFDYTHIGWASTPGGGWDETILNAITEDKTVYAAFAAAVRYYTISYYVDGVLDKQESLAYGAMPEYVPDARDGYTFLGWTPALATVTGDASYTAQWEELSGWAYEKTATLPRIPRDVAINPAGTMLAACSGGNYADVFMMDLTGETPVRINEDVVVSGDSYYSEYVDFNSAGSAILFSGTYNGKGGIKKTNISSDGTASAFTTEQTGSSADTHMVRCSPTVSSEYMYRCYISSTVKYALSFSKGSYVAPGNSVSGMTRGRYSPDGTLVAGPIKTTGQGVMIIDNATVTELRRIGAVSDTYPVDASFSADGSKLAVSYYAAPYLAVYDTETGEELWNLTDELSAMPQITFATGTNDLVVACGTTVRVFDLSSANAQEVENIPVYAGQNIRAVASNHTGTRVAFISDVGKGVEIWSRY